MNESVLLKYGQAIRAIRQSKSISQEQLADRSGLHRTYISDVELGKRNVSLENIEKIAYALNTNMSTIFIEVEKIESI